MADELAVIVKESGLDSTKAQILLDNFSGYFQIASEWEEKARTIIVKDASQKAEMEMARVGRLFLREKRIKIEKTRKELKEKALREGKAIDGIANILKALIVPIEEYLEQQEKFVEIKAKKEAEIIRIETEKKEEEERLAKEEAERKEQEKIRLENERLKKEAIAKEKKIQVEREKAEVKRKEIENKAKWEREVAEGKRLALEEKVRKEKTEAEHKARVEREKQERILAEQRAQAEKRIRLEREKAEKEREKIQAKLNELIECPFCHKKFALRRN